MNLRVLLLALAILLAAAVLIIPGHRDAQVEKATIDSGSEAEAPASSSEPDPRLPEAEVVPETAEPADFAITEDEFDEFRMTLLRSLDQQFRASIDADVKSLWDTTAAEGNESNRDGLKPSHGDQN